MTVRRLFFAGLLMAASAVAPPAGAIPNTCPTTGPDAGVVTITEPGAGATFAGSVTVRGRASAVAGVSRVDLFAGEALVDYQSFDPPRTEVEYLLRFDVASVRSDKPVLTVVACGGRPGAAVRGVASLGIAVDRPSVSTAPPRALTTAARDGAGSPARRSQAWVGLVFGAAGLAGLMWAFGVRGRGGEAARSRPSQAPPPVLPPAPEGMVAALRRRSADAAPTPAAAEPVPAPVPAPAARKGRRREEGSPAGPNAAGAGGPPRSNRRR